MLPDRCHPGGAGDSPGLRVQTFEAHAARLWQAPRDGSAARRTGDTSSCRTSPSCRVLRFYSTEQHRAVSALNSASQREKET